MTPPFADDCADVPRPTTVADFPRALAAIERTLATGEPIHRGAWRTQPAPAHVRHAQAHLAAWMAGDATEDHLGHALTRVAMAVELAPTNSEFRDRSSPADGEPRAGSDVSHAQARTRNFGICLGVADHPSSAHLAVALVCDTYDPGPDLAAVLHDRCARERWDAARAFAEAQHAVRTALGLPPVADTATAVRTNNDRSRSPLADGRQ